MNRHNSAQGKKHPEYVFDFNDPRLVLPETAACSVKDADLEKLFRELDAANEKVPIDARRAVLESLKAVVKFLNAGGLNTNGRYSRPLELLYARLRQLPPDEKNRILAPRDGAPGGDYEALEDRHVKAAAACAVELLHEPCGLSVTEASNQVAALLTDRSFRAGTKRDRATVVRNWRRDFRKAGAASETAQYFRDYCKDRRETLTGNAATDRESVLHWLQELVERAGHN